MKNLLTHTTEYLGNTVDFDIKPDYATIRTMNSERAEIYIIDTLLDGLGILSKHRKKFPNFDSYRFAAAFAACLGKSTQ